MPLSVMELCSATTPDDVFCLAFSDDSQHITAGCSNGNIITFGGANGRQMYSISPTSGAGSFPVTCIRYRPFSESMSTRNVLLATTSTGLVQHWHVSSSRNIHTISEHPNQTYTCDYRHDGMLFATAGSDHIMRVYSEETKTLISQLSGGHGDVTAGNSNRVFALKWHPTDPNVFLAGGWDNVVAFYDIRVPHAVRSIFGPHMCGDALRFMKGDSASTEIVTGSWRTEDQLQIWNYDTGALLRNVSVQGQGARGEANMLYAVDVSPNGKLIAFCGSGANEARVIEASTGMALSVIRGEGKAFFSCAFSPDGTKVAFAAGCKITVLEIRDM
eukprot:ANDGO_04350.mRNA.1 putative WD repeat-containing protein alr2800